MDLDKAFALLAEHVSQPGLLKHCLSVEAAMRAYARKYGADEELWGATGLLHDFDYEKHPVPDPAAKTGHPFEGVKILRDQGYPEEMTEAILGHATYSGTPRTSQMAKCLYACDELCGLVLALAYVRPERFKGMDAASVEKAMKKKKFAEKVSREEIGQGIAELGVPREEHFRTVVEAMRGIQEELFPEAG